MDNNFLSKIRYISGERDLTPWIKGLGFSDGAVSRVLKGERPAPELLFALQRTERLDLRWLEQGVGTPYRVNRATSDTEGEGDVGELVIDDAEWTVYLVSGPPGQGFCVVLTSPDSYEYRGKTIQYTEVEVIGGRIGRNTWNRALAAVEEGHRLLFASATLQDLEALDEGDMGNMALLGWRDRRKSARGLLDETRVRPFGSGAAPEYPGTPWDREIADWEELTAAELALVKHFRRLSDDDRAALLRMAQALDGSPSGD